MLIGSRVVLKFSAPLLTQILSRLFLSRLPFAMTENSSSNYEATNTCATFPRVSQF